jgi:hypothetical protein
MNNKPEHTMLVLLRNGIEISVDEATANDMQDVLIGIHDSMSVSVFLPIGEETVCSTEIVGIFHKASLNQK